MCYDVIRSIPGVQYIAPQGSCAYTPGGDRYCPDIYGTYQEKGFVIDCKHYNPGRCIDAHDRNKLDRDRDQVQIKLKKLMEDGQIQGAITTVVKMFVTTEGNGEAAVHARYKVITVGRPGAPGWKTKLKEGFIDEMK